MAKGKKAAEEKPPKEEVEDEMDEDDEDEDLEEEEEEEKPKKKAAKKAAPKKEKTATKGGVKKEGKKAKDPNAPKRGLSAFMFFSQDKREQVKADNPELGFGETGKKLGEMWRNCSPTDKKKYEEKAAKDKARYEKEKAAAASK